MANLNKIKQMNDTQIQEWLRKVGRENVEKLGMAMLGECDEVQDLIYKNMSQRAGEMLRKDINKYKMKGMNEKYISSCAAEMEKLF